MEREGEERGRGRGREGEREKREGEGERERGRSGHRNGCASIGVVGSSGCAKTIEQLCMVMTCRTSDNLQQLTTTNNLNSWPQQTISTHSLKR